MNDPNEITTGAPNGLASDYVPVMGTTPVTQDEAAPKPKRARKPRKKAATPRAPRTKRIDPLLAEQTSKTPQPSHALEASFEETATAAPPTVAVAPLHRERSLKRMFSDNAPRPERHPPLKSGWGQRFVAGFLHMVGFDPVSRATVSEPDGPEGVVVVDIAPKVWADLSRTDIAIWACLFASATLAGLTMPWW
jgi:hypothetical protein